MHFARDDIRLGFGSNRVTTDYLQRMRRKVRVRTTFLKREGFSTDLYGTSNSKRSWKRTQRYGRTRYGPSIFHSIGT